MPYAVQGALLPAISCSPCPLHAEIPMRFDPMRSGSVLFLFATSIVAQDWTQWVGAAPPVAMMSSMVYDLQRGCCVRFGGWNTRTSVVNYVNRNQTSYPFTVLDQTWEFDGTTWTQRTTSVVPPARDS